MNSKGRTFSLHPLHLPKEKTVVIEDVLQEKIVFVIETMLHRRWLNALFIIYPIISFLVLSLIGDDLVKLINNLSRSELQNT